MCDLSINFIGGYSQQLYDLPLRKEPFKIVSLGSIGPVPIFAKIGLDLTLDFDFSATVAANLEFGMRPTLHTELGVAYINGATPPIKGIGKFEPTLAVIPFNSTLSGAVGAGFTLNPRLEILIYGAAGFATGPSISGHIIAKKEGSEPLTVTLEREAEWGTELAGLFEKISNLSFSEHLWSDTKTLWPKGGTLRFISQPQNTSALEGSYVTFIADFPEARGHHAISKAVGAVKGEIEALLHDAGLPPAGAFIAQGYDGDLKPSPRNVRGRYTRAEIAVEPEKIGEIAGVEAEQLHHFVGIDALPHEGVAYVKQGILDATFEYPTGGKEAIEVALKILNGEKVPKEIELSSRVYIKDQPPKLLK